MGPQTPQKRAQIKDSTGVKTPTFVDGLTDGNYVLKQNKGA